MITKVINVNLHQPIYERLTAKQGDIASRYLLFHLLDGDKPFDLSNRTVRVYAIKPDKTEIFNDLTINDASKGYCTLELTSQCLASAGVVKMELYISQSGKVLTSIPFELEVIACINTVNGVTSTNEFSALEVALNSLQDYNNLRREIIQARKGHETVGERLDNFDSQLDTINQQMNEPYHYYVGKNQKFKTITEAFNEWLKHKQPSIIHIKSGVYYEFVKYTSYCNCSFIGECKETTVVYSRSGKYEEAPLTVQGDLTIENLTLKVDSSENSDFTENTNPAYALHIDSPNVEGTTVVRNCDLISYVNAGLGCGTRQNQTIILEDTNIYNYRNIGDYRYKMGMLYHNSATNGHINQNIKMKNVKAYSKNGRALMIYSYNTDDTKAQFEAVNTTLLSDVYEGNDVYFYNKDASDNVVITGLEINDGSSKEVSDCNLAPNGNFKCNGATGGLNMPFPRWGIGNTISFDKETFKIQTIYDVTKNFECYQRTKNATVWSDWELIDGQYAKNSNDSNLCLSNGLYVTNVNTPTSDQFMIDCKFANSFYGLQEAYRLTDMKLWKRTYINKVFSEWVVV